MRPYWEHDYHFHVRIKCPDDSPTCKHQDPVPAGDGCGKDLDWWFTDAVLHPKPSTEPEKPRPLHQDGGSAAVLPAGAGRAVRSHVGGLNSGASIKASPTVTRSPQPATTAVKGSAFSAGTRIRIGSPAHSR